LAKEVVATTRRRTKGQVGIPYVTDGWAPYAETIKEVYRDREVSKVNPQWAIVKPTAGIALTQAVKHRKGLHLERVEVRVVMGAQAELPYAVHLERLNGVLRDRLNCLTRKTHAFAKDVATWDALLSVALFEHNWFRPDVALRVPLAELHQGRRFGRRTPAMAMGLTDHVWSWEEILRLPISQRSSRSRPECETAEKARRDPLTPPSVFVPHPVSHGLAARHEGEKDEHSTGGSVERLPGEGQSPGELKGDGIEGQRQESEARQGDAGFAQTPDRDGGPRAIV
jgi:hypothetical protein